VIESRVQMRRGIGAALGVAQRAIYYRSTPSLPEACPPSP